MFIGIIIIEALQCLKKRIYNQEQVVAPKGLDISHTTTVVMPNHIRFAQHFSQKDRISS